MNSKKWLMGVFITAMCWLHPAASAEIDTLHTRICKDYLTASTTNAPGYLSSQLADGSWSDIDYADTARTNWKPGTHLSRLQTMSVAFNKVGDANYHGSAMGAGIKKGLSFWYTRKARSNNWWYNDIGQQLNLGPVLMLMRDSLSSALRDTGCTYLLDPKMTGQNLVWYS
jgi:chondroitin AC lyase